MQENANIKTILRRNSFVPGSSEPGGILQIFIQSQRTATTPLCWPGSPTAWVRRNFSDVAPNRYACQYHYTWHQGKQSGRGERFGWARSCSGCWTASDRDQVSIHPTTV